MQGFLSRDGMPPAELLAAGARRGPRLRRRAHRRPRSSRSSRLHAPARSEAAPLTARRLLLATGAVDELPEIPGARERWGRDFLHCPYCHGWEVRDQPLGVLGTVPARSSTRTCSGNGPTTSSSSRTRIAATDDERAALDARGIDVVDGIVARLVVVDDRLSARASSTTAARSRATRSSCGRRFAPDARRPARRARLRGRRGGLRPRRRRRPDERRPASGRPATPPTRARR